MNFFKKDSVFDGAMGTMLLAAGLPTGMRTERANVAMPTAVEKIHRAFAESGADYITANTFGANAAAESDFADLIAAGIRLAKKTKRPVGLDVGPIGVAAKTADFDTLYALFRKSIEAGAAAGADFIIIETMTNLVELRAALLAAKEHSRLPVAATMSFERSGRTVYGVRPDSFACIATALGADAVGANCSTGPADMAVCAADMLRATKLPIIMQPNAGLPIMRGGVAFYDMTPDAFREEAKKLKALGVDILGGCCGTTPDCIAAVKAIKADGRPTVDVGALCSGARYIVPTYAVVGERINPTGKPKFRAALTEGRLECLDALCREQMADGADLLDVNVGVAGFERELIEKVLPKVADASPLPLVLDSSDVAVLERGLRLYPGRALVNSVCGKDAVLDSVLPLVKRYGAAVVGLTLDDDGIPETADGRIRIAEKILRRAAEHGIAPHDVYIDALTLSEASVPGGAAVTLETVERVKRLGARTILGVSNVSFGMPLREDINAAFLNLARAKGLTLAIINPHYAAFEGSAAATDFLCGRLSAEDFIAKAQGVTVAPPETGRALTLREAVVAGDATAAALAAESLLKELPPLAVAERQIIPALNEIGDGYAKGELFLPALIAAADAAEAAFRLVREKFDGKRGAGTLVIATVKGDIHDIGKNITAAVAASYGIEVVDLGKDVSTERVLEAVRAHLPCAVGLSALMTTTAANMAETAAAVRAAFPDVPILSGGAAITPEFCREIGTVYCATATDTARWLADYFKKR